MTLQEMIDGIDQDLPQTNGYDSPSTGADIDLFAQETQVNAWIGWSEEFERRMVMHWVTSWRCTDTVVGRAIVFLDREPVALYEKYARKSNANVEFFSGEAFYKVRDLVLKCSGPEHVINTVSLTDVPPKIEPRGDFPYQRFA